MKNCLLLLLCIFAAASHASAEQQKSGKEQQPVCSAVNKTVKVPEQFSSISAALSANPTPKAGPGKDPVIVDKLSIEVTARTEDYVQTRTIMVDRPCTAIVGIPHENKKPVLRRDTFGQYEQAVVQIAASNVSLSGFEIKGAFVTDPISSPYGVLVVIPKEDVKNIGYQNITIQNNEISHIGFDYPKNPDQCWKTELIKGEKVKTYTCGSAHGIEIKSNISNPITGIKIIANVLHHLQLGQSEAVTVANNVSDFHVENNEIYQADNIGIDIAGFQDEKDSLPPTSGTVTGNLVYQSTTKNNPGQEGTYPWIAGIYLDGGRGSDLAGGKLLVEKNVVYDYGFGIEIAAEKSGKKVENIIAQNNLVFDNWVVGIGIGHSGEEQQSYAENCLIQNNTLYRNNRYGDGKDRGEFRISKSSEKPFVNISLKDNLVVDTGGRCLIYSEVKPENKFDIAFVNDLFIGTKDRFWDCSAENRDFPYFKNLKIITVSSDNEYLPDYPFEKIIPEDPNVIIKAIRDGTVRGFFKTKPFVKARGINLW